MTEAWPEVVAAAHSRLAPTARSGRRSVGAAAAAAAVVVGFVPVSRMLAKLALETERGVAVRAPLWP